MAHGGMKLVKLLLFIFNFIFWLTGLGLIVFGVVIKIQNWKYLNVLGDSFLAASILLIAAGCLIAVLGFFGCCGAVRENYCMTMTFGILLGVMFILELAAGIASYVLRNDLETTLTRQVSDGMNNYVNSSNPADSYTNAWDYVQQHLNCCGTVNYTDWENTSAFKNKPVPISGAHLLPHSCCDAIDINESCYSDSWELHKHGCIDQIKRWAESNVTLMGSVALGVAFIQVIGMAFACCLSKSILKDHDDYYY